MKLSGGRNRRSRLSASHWPQEEPLPRAIALLGLIACLGGCASTSRFDLSAKEMRAAYDDAPWRDPPEATVIPIEDFTTARCFKTAPTRAVCRYGYRYRLSEPYHQAYRAVVQQDGAWVFNLDSPNVHEWGDDTCAALAAMLARHPVNRRVVGRMLRTSSPGRRVFGPELLTPEEAAALETTRREVHERSADAVLDCRFPPSLHVRIEDGSLENSRATLVLHFPIEHESGRLIEVEEEVRTAQGFSHTRVLFAHDPETGQLRHRATIKISP